MRLGSTYVGFSVKDPERSMASTCIGLTERPPNRDSLLSTLEGFTAGLGVGVQLYGFVALGNEKLFSAVPM